MQGFGTVTETCCSSPLSRINPWFRAQMKSTGTWLEREWLWEGHRGDKQETHKFIDQRARWRRWSCSQAPVEDSWVMGRRLMLSGNSVR